MKFVNQLDYPEVPYITRQEMEDEASREKGKKTTVATSACGLCSAIIVVDRLLVNTELSLEEAIRLSYASKANLRIGTDYTVFAPALAERFGLDLEMRTIPSGFFSVFGPAAAPSRNPPATERAISAYSRITPTTSSSLRNSGTGASRSWIRPSKKESTTRKGAGTK